MFTSSPKPPRGSTPGERLWDFLKAIALLALVVGLTIAAIMFGLRSGLIGLGLTLAGALGLKLFAAPWWRESERFQRRDR